MNPLEARYLQRVFVDSSAYDAGSVARDTNHDTAQVILRAVVRRGIAMVTTRYIVAASHALVIHRLRDTHRAAELLRRVEAGASTTVVAATDGDEARARAIIERYDDHLFTLTDASSFAVVERLELVYAFSFDGDFAAFGFMPLTLDLLR